MMTQTASNYAKALSEAGFTKAQLDDVLAVFDACEPLMRALSAPTVPEREKEAAADALFQGEAANLVKLMCANGCIRQIYLVAQALEKLELENRGVAVITIRCVTPPDDQQCERIKKFICKKHGYRDASVVIQRDPSLLGGFQICCGDTVYDRSYKGRLNALKQNLVGGSGVNEHHQFK